MGLAAIFVLAVVACVVYGSDWLTLWIYVSAATGFVVPGRTPAMRAVVGVSACYALLAWVAHASMPTFVLNLLPVVLIGWAMAGFRYQATLVHELSLARETVGKLAASEERLRLARDMHDLTGQSLSMITLKSELVGKLLARLPDSKDRDAVLREAGDISQVSRRTLHDIRDVVSGYRRPTLAVEIITARTALDAAGIHLDDDPALTLRSGTFDPEAEAALAWLPARGHDERDPSLGRAELPGAADPARQRAVARGHRRRPRAAGPGRPARDRPGGDAGQRATRHVRAADRHRRPAIGGRGQGRRRRPRPAAGGDRPGAGTGRRRR
jgi:hypothetical protein